MTHWTTRAILALSLLLTASVPVLAAPEQSTWARGAISGLKPLTPEMLARIDALAARLAASAPADARVLPAMRQVLGEEDRGLVKRAVAARVLALLGHGGEVAEILAPDATPAAGLIAQLVESLESVHPGASIARR